MLRTFSGRQPHPAAAEAPQPGYDPAAAGAVAPPPLPERPGTPSQDAGSPSTESPPLPACALEEPPPAGSVAAGEAAWEAQLAALEAAKAAKRASSAAPLVGGSPSPDHGDVEEDASDDSDAEDDELTAAIAEARNAARRISLSVDEAPPPAHVARASMAAARDGFARRGERLEGVNRATEGLAEAARQYRENARKREAEARKSRSRWF